MQYEKNDCLPIPVSGICCDVGQNAGFFAEPHVGWRFDRHHALALGLLVQQCDVSHRTTTSNSGETLSTNVYKQDVTGAITLRYAYSF